jgi:hypothetical protein
MSGEGSQPPSTLRRYESLEKRDAALVAIGFLGLLHSAEGSARGLSCGARGHAAPEVLLGEQVEMGSDLGLDLLIEPPAPEQGSEARGSCAQPTHLKPPERFRAGAR